MKKVHSLSLAKLHKAALVMGAMASALSASPIAYAATPEGTGTNPATNPSPSGNVSSDNPIVKDINVIVNFLSIGVGIVVIMMIIIGGIQYSAAGDNPQALSAAKQRITNALIALFAYLFIFAFLQWLIPGGVFS